MSFNFSRAQRTFSASLQQMDANHSKAFDDFAAKLYDMFLQNPKINNPPEERTVPASFLIVPPLRRDTLKWDTYWPILVDQWLYLGSQLVCLAVAGRVWLVQTLHKLLIFLDLGGSVRGKDRYWNSSHNSHVCYLYAALGLVYSA